MAILSSSYEVESGFKTTLKVSINQSQTTGIIINAVPTITKGVLNFDADTAREEWISFGGITNNGDGTATLVDVVRGLTKTANDFTGAAARTFSHSGGVCVVRLVDYHALFNLKAGVDKENTFTADQTIGVGKVVKFVDGNATIRRDGDDLKFKDPNQSEVSLSTLAAAAGLNDKAKISVADTTEGYLNDKLNFSSEFTTSIGNPGGDETLNISLGAIQAQYTGKSIDANQSITTGDLVAFDGQQRLVKAQATSLDKAYLFAGQSLETGIAGDPLKVAMSGIVTLPTAFTSTDRINCREHNGEFQTSSNTTSDTLSSTTQWRAQSFIPKVNEDNVSLVTLNLTNSSFSGVLTCAIYATSGGVPTGAALGSITKASANVTSGENEFIFSAPIAVTPLDTYAIVLRVSTYTSGNVAWNYQNTNVYANGQRITSSDSGVNWTPDASSDYRFLVKYRGISGEPVYLSNTAGAISLTPGTYAKKIGYALSPSQAFLLPESPAIYATYSFSSSAGTVDTELILGFRPKKLTFYATGTVGTATRALIGSWLNGGQVGVLTVYNIFSSSAWRAQLFSSSLGSLDEDTGGGGVVTFSVQGFSANSITIRRVDSGGWGTVNVYLFIEG